MFTGLVEHIGVVDSIQPIDPSQSGGNGFSITIKDSQPILTDCHIGDSISVNGACLTVTEFDAKEHEEGSGSGGEGVGGGKGGWFKVGLAPETLDRTALGGLKVGDGVNLERALQSGARYGGHFVQGHVDSTAVVTSVTSNGNALDLLFTFPDTPLSKSLLPSLIPKGYVAIDGTSLTLTSVNDTRRTFGVMLISHTQEKVVLSKKKAGDLVNIEVDMVAKSVSKAVSKALGGGGDEGEEVGSLKNLVDAAVEKALKARGI